MKNHLLAIYLNDHLAGSMAGLELLRRCLRSNARSPLGNTLRNIEAELREDRAQLRRALHALQITPKWSMEALGWMAEKLGRLKPNGHLVTYSPLSRLVELEGLLIGVQGKLAMWSVLGRLAISDSRLREIDFDKLKDTAKQQVQLLEAHRVKAAHVAFQPSAPFLEEPLHLSAPIS